MRYEVYACRWDDPHVVEEIIPARGLSFSMPLSDHGECGFTATVEPGRSFWRPALAAATSGVLVCRDDVPLWTGRMTGERQTGPRAFEFRFAEWGSAFEDVPAVPLAVTGVNDHALFRRLISDAQAVAGQNYQVQLGSTLGAARSDLTINPWDRVSVEEQCRRVGEAQGGPEWYFGAGGTLENPTRHLVLGDRLGDTTPATLLEYVEDTEDYVPPAAPPAMSLLGAVFPIDSRPIRNGGRRGGNVIAHPSRRVSAGHTAAVAIGSGQEAAQLRESAEASDLLAAGFPRRTRWGTYADVSVPATLQRHAAADLAASRGMVTSYTLTTLEDDPDWTQVARGSTVRVSLDTDVYAGARPLEFDARVLDISVMVADDGPVRVNWTIADVIGA